jgi:hypothetical protein
MMFYFLAWNSSTWRSYREYVCFFGLPEDQSSRPLLQVRHVRRAFTAAVDCCG